jgi:GH43 family beta-xylosidase
MEKLQERAAAGGVLGAHFSIRFAGERVNVAARRTLLPAVDAGSLNAVPEPMSRRPMRRGALALAILAVVACHGATPRATRETRETRETRAAAAPFANPIVRQRADPHVFRDADGTYYFAATVPEYDRIELRRAPSIQALGTAEPVVVWRRHTSGEMGAHIWAPEIHKIDGKWYVYFAAGRADSVWNIRIYVLENASPNALAGAWVEKGQLHTGWESFALDATTFEHRGTRYLVWAQQTPGIRANSSLYIAAMANPWTIRGTPVLLSRPEFEWETRGFRVNEGPAVLIRHGRVFLTYSASATDANYCMGMLTASDTSDLLDPRSWTKSPVPVFATNDSAGVYGPGHNAFTVDRDGSDVLVYHARSYRDIVGDPLNDPNRNTRAQRIRWRTDGTPDFGVPLGDRP